MTQAQSWDGILLRTGRFLWILAALALVACGLCAQSLLASLSGSTGG